MKKKIHTFSLLLFFSLLPMALFNSCDSDTNSYLEVLVIDEIQKTPVSGAVVETYQFNCNESDYNYRSGVTNGEGIFTTSFINPAIISIQVRLNLENGGYRMGTGTVRLIEGETKTTQVVLSSEVRF
jgi:hypothetical protein